MNNDSANTPKKLKQMRLPFVPIDKSKTTQLNIQTKKRKLSDSGVTELKPTNESDNEANNFKTQSPEKSMSEIKTSSLKIKIANKRRKLDKKHSNSTDSDDSVELVFEFESQKSENLTKNDDSEVKTKQEKNLSDISYNSSGIKPIVTFPSKFEVISEIKKSDNKAEVEEEQKVSNEPAEENCNLLLLDGYRTKIKVHIAKHKVCINELKDDLDKAVSDQNFINAQKIKLQIDSSVSTCNEIQAELDKYFNDSKYLKEMLDKFNTPVSTPVRKSSQSPLTSADKEDTKQKKVEEKLKKKEQDRLKKEQERLKKEEDRLKKEEEKELKIKKKEEERIEREKERLQKELLKKEKEKKKEEEKNEKLKLKEEERLEKIRTEDNLKKKKEKAAQNFAAFFVKTEDKNGSNAKASVESINNLNTFCVKQYMKLAPLTRVQLEDSKKKELESLILSSNSNVSYLDDLNSDAYNPRKSSRTWKLDIDDEVEIIEDDEENVEGFNETVADETISKKSYFKAKLLQFIENRRPPYWGTWGKKSVIIGGRTPFKKDSDLFDYDYDSDDDWEEEEQGESLSDEELDKEEDEDDNAGEDEDDGFFVGHGVLDKDEIQNEDEAIEYNADLEAMKQKLKAQAFEEEYNKKKMLKIKAKVFGLYWEGEEKESQPSIVHEQLKKILSPMKSMLLANNNYIHTSFSTPITETGSLEGVENCPAITPNRKTKEVSDQAIPHLIRLLHANSHSMHFLSREFALYWSKEHPKDEESQFSRRMIFEKIREIAEYKKVPELVRRAWIVKDEYLKNYNLKDSLSIPNNLWVYSLQQPTAANNSPKPLTVSNLDASPSRVFKGPSVSPSKSPSFSGKSLITKFTKIVNQEDVKRNESTQCNKKS